MQRASSWISSQAWQPSCASRCQTLRTQSLNQMAQELKKPLLDRMLLERSVLGRCIGGLMDHRSQDVAYCSVRQNKDYIQAVQVHAGTTYSIQT